MHFMRNLLAHVGKQGRRVVAVATAFAREDAEMARAQWRQVAASSGPRSQRAILMDEAEADVLAFMSFPRSQTQDPQAPVSIAAQGGQQPGRA